MERRIDALLKLEEYKERDKQMFNMHQQFVNQWFDQISTSNKEFSGRWSSVEVDKDHKDKWDHNVGIFYIPWKVVMSLYYVRRYPQSYVKE